MKTDLGFEQVGFNEVRWCRYRGNWSYWHIGRCVYVVDISHGSWKWSVLCERRVRESSDPQVKPIFPSLSRFPSSEKCLLCKKIAGL